jgi:hypothetical protein
VVCADPVTLADKSEVAPDVGVSNFPTLTVLVEACISHENVWLSIVPVSEKAY